MDDNAKEKKPDARSQPTIDDIRKESTLDFYNDDMPRRAVGKLFYEEEDDDARIAVVQGYHEDQPDEELEQESVKPEERDPVYDFDIKDIRKSKSTMLDYDMSLYRSKTKEEDEPVFMAKQSSLKTEPEFYNKQPASAAAETKRQVSTFSLNTTSQIRIGVSVAFLLLFLVLTMMIFQVNAANAKIKDLETKVAAGQQAETAYNELKDASDKQKSEIERLEEALATVGSTPPQTNTANAPDTSTSTSTELTESGDTMYTVQKGDNLSKISKKFYGDANQFQKIVDANSLTNDSIVVGQSLLIPQ